MIGLILICISFLALLVGTVAHFRVLVRLESSGVSVKYFANVGDSLRAYKTYRHLAPHNGWPRWPSYVVFAGYVGVLLAGLAFFLDSPIPRIVKWFQ